MIDITSGQVALEAGYDDMISARFDLASHRLFVARTDGIVEMREGAAWHVARRLAYPAPSPSPEDIALAVDRNGDRIAVVARNPIAYVIPTNGEPTTELSGHEKGVADVLFDATGRRVVTRSWDQTVRVWDARSGTLLHKLNHPADSFSAEITRFAVSDEGSTIVSAMRSGELFVWDAESGERRWVLSHKAYVNDVAIAPGGRLMATASDDRTAAIWDLQTGQQRFRLKHDEEVWSLVMAADGRTLVTGSKDGWVRFFDLASGTELRRVRLDGGVSGLAFDPSSSALAVGIALSGHRQAWTDVAIVDFKTHTPVSSFSHNGGFSHMAFSPDGGSLATTLFKTEEIKLWDVASGRLRSVPEAKAQGLFFTPDGARLVTDPGSGEAFLLDAATGHPLAAIGEPGGVKDFGLAADGRTLTTYGEDGWFRGWDAITGKELWQRKKAPGGNDTKLSADGQRFATASANGSAVEVYEAKDGQLIASIPLMASEPSFTLSADGRRLLLIRIKSPDDKPSNEVELWDVDRAERVLRRQLPIGTPYFLDTGDRAMILDPAARSAELVDAGNGKTIWAGKSSESGFFEPLVAGNRLIADGGIWDLGTGKLIARDIGNPDAVAATSDGAKLMLAVGQHVEIRDARNGRLLRRLEAGGCVSDLELSEDGRFLYAACIGLMRIMVWNVHDGSELARIQMDGAAKRMRPLADPDRVLVHHYGERLRVWRVSTGREERRFAHTATVEDIAVAAVADRAITKHGATIRLWDTRTGAEIAHHLGNGRIETQSLAISPDGRWVGYRADRSRPTDTDEADVAVVLWEPDSGRDPRLLSTTNAQEIVFSPESKRIAARPGNDTVAIWDIGSLRSLATLGGLPGSTVSEIAFSPDGARLLITERGTSRCPKPSYCMSLRVWDVAKTLELARVDFGGVLLQIPGSDTVMTRTEGSWRAWSHGATSVDPITPWPGDSLKTLERTPLGGRLLKTHGDGSATLLDTDTGEQVPVAPPREETIVDAAAVARGARFVALGLRWLPSVKDASPIAHVYDVETASSVANLPHDAEITDLLFVDDDEAIVTASKKTSWLDEWASRLHLWRWRSGETKTLIADNPIPAVAATPDGAIFATGEGAEGIQDDSAIGISQARLWNARTGKELLRLPHPEPVYDVAFSPDGHLLGTRSTHHISVYRVRDGVKLTSFRMEQGLVGGQVAFASDGQRVIANVKEGVRIWNLDGTESRLLRHENDWSLFALSGGGTHLATLDEKTIRVWDIASGAELARATLPDAPYGFAFAGKRDDLFVSSGDRLVRVLWRTEDLIGEACRRIPRDQSKEGHRSFDAPLEGDPCGVGASTETTRGAN